MAKANRDFEELFECLRRREVRALVVGAHAVAFYAKPRYTKDVDVWIEPTAINAQRLLQALDDFGFGSLDLSIEDFSTPGSIVQLGVEPNRIDFLTDLESVPFAEAWKRRVPGSYGGQDVFYIALEDLKTVKASAGRPQDLVDLEWLQGLGTD